jgi:hypothetical protein
MSLGGRLLFARLLRWYPYCVGFELPILALTAVVNPDFHATEPILCRYRARAVCPIIHTHDLNEKLNLR